MTLQVTWVAIKNKDPFNPKTPNGKKLNMQKEEKVVSEAGAH